VVQPHQTALVAYQHGRHQADLSLDQIAFAVLPNVMTETAQLAKHVPTTATDANQALQAAQLIALHAQAQTEDPPQPAPAQQAILTMEWQTVWPATTNAQLATQIQQTA
jgi:hypothetical protein